ncbi:MAG: peptide deformylase [Balneolaceae bacterium]|nr:peptide deformylase [Balneolaceae bacterium]
MVLPIRAYGDPILHISGEEIQDDSPALQQLIDDMLETMRGADGAGLAAPQVGQLFRIFVADLSSAWESLPKEKRPEIPQQPMVCINPEILHSSQKEEEFEEGCLSIPNLNIKVRRPNEVTLRYLDRNFEVQTIKGVGVLASILQHENDHLNGVLHIDHLSVFRKKIIQKRLNQIERGVFEAGYPIQIGDKS